MTYEGLRAAATSGHDRKSTRHALSRGQGEAFAIGRNDQDIKSVIDWYGIFPETYEVNFAPERRLVCYRLEPPHVCISVWPGEHDLPRDYYL